MNSTGDEEKQAGNILGFEWLSNRQKPACRRRFKRAYFYYNGTHSLMPQVVVALAIIFLRSIEQRNIESDCTWVILLGFIFFSVSYIWYVTYYKIPKLLFEIYGYSKHDRFLKRLARHIKYGYNMLTAPFIAAILSATLYILGYSITAVWFRHHV